MVCLIHGPFSAQRRKENMKEKFCGECGARLDEATGLCPKCDAEKLRRWNEWLDQPKWKEPAEAPKQRESAPAGRREEKKKQRGTGKKEQKQQKKDEKKKKKKEKWAKKTSGQKFGSVFLRLILWIVLIAIIAGGVSGVLTYYGLIKVPYVIDVLQKLGVTSDAMDADDNLASHTVTPPDAEEYFSNNSQIVAEIAAEDSEDVSTEAETCTMLESRNFVDYSVITEYSMDGSYSDAANISGNSSEKHPIYQTYYVTDNDELWTIFLINGVVMANPVSYNLQSELETQVIISEKDTVTSYDSATNTFYETIPDQSALIVITVERIDAETLDRLTIEEIERRV